MCIKNLFSCLFFSIAINALDVPPKVRTALVRFYQEHNLSTDGVSFEQDPFLFYDKQQSLAYARAATLTIALSPELQKNILRAIAQNKSFDYDDQYALLHEYGHLQQDFINAILQNCKDALPPIVNAENTNEAAADLFAYVTMKPRILKKHFQRCSKKIRELEMSGFLFISTLLEKALHNDNGHHLDSAQSYHMLAAVHDMQCLTVQGWQKHGYSLNEIEYYWPKEPQVRRITY